MKEVYCSSCGFAPMIEEEPRKDDLNDHPWYDILCGNCHLVLLTVRIVAAVPA